MEPEAEAEAAAASEEVPRLRPKRRIHQSDLELLVVPQKVEATKVSHSDSR